MTDHCNKLFHYMGTSVIWIPESDLKNYPDPSTVTYVAGSEFLIQHVEHGCWSKGTYRKTRQPQVLTIEWMQVIVIKNQPIKEEKEKPKMTGVFVNGWDSKESMIADFEGVYRTEDLTEDQKAKYDHVEVLLASYGTDNYSGDAFVLFRNTKNGQLYENHGSHCSCYGLEDQWGEEETNIESLEKRLTDDSLGSDDYSDNIFKDELAEVLKELKGESS